MEKVKTRILEFLAVCKLKGDMRGSILCMVSCSRMPLQTLTPDYPLCFYATPAVDHRGIRLQGNFCREARYLVSVVVLFLT